MAANDECGEDCVCCSVPYESFCETIQLNGQKCVCGQCSGDATIICYEHTIPQSKGCEKEEEREKKECKCGVCGGGAIFDDNHVEINDGEEREKMCCPCTNCADAPIWNKPAWKTPNLRALVEETETLMVEAGEAINKMENEIDGVEERAEKLVMRKFCQNQEQDAYVNGYENAY